MNENKNYYFRWRRSYYSLPVKNETTPDLLSEEISRAAANVRKEKLMYATLMRKPALRIASISMKMLSTHI